MMGQDEGSGLFYWLSCWNWGFHCIKLKLWLTYVRHIRCFRQKATLNQLQKRKQLGKGAHQTERTMDAAGTAPEISWSRIQDFNPILFLPLFFPLPSFPFFFSLSFSLLSFIFFLYSFLTHDLTALISAVFLPITFLQLIFSKREKPFVWQSGVSSLYLYCKRRKGIWVQSPDQRVS